MQTVTASPSAPKNNTKADDGGKAKESAPSSDQLVPDYAAGPVISSPFVCVLQEQIFPAIFAPFNSRVTFSHGFVWPTGRDQECVRWKAANALFTIKQL